MADPEVDLFAGMKKKKKKQVVLDVEEALPAPAAETSKPAPVEPVATAPAADYSAAPAAPAPSALDEAAGGSGAATPVEGDKVADGADADLFADMKKKKKKKKEIPLDLEAGGDAAAAPTLDGIDVPIKKKKSRKPASDFAKELDDLEGDGADDAAAGGDADGLDGDDPFERGGTNGETGTGQEAWVLEGRDPTYQELLSRFFHLLHQHNPELAGDKKRYTIVPPQVAREGTKKTVFANISDICRRMHRQPEHVIQFLYAELGTQGSIDGAQRLIMKGRYTQKQIENVLRKYIMEYVTCKICKSPDTILEREARLNFLHCEACGSRLSVSAIKAGYQAQIGKRIKAA